MLFAGLGSVRIVKNYDLGFQRASWANEDAKLPEGS